MACFSGVARLGTVIGQVNATSTPGDGEGALLSSTGWSQGTGLVFCVQVLEEEESIRRNTVTVQYFGRGKVRQHE